MLARGELIQGVLKSVLWQKTKETQEHTLQVGSSCPGNISATTVGNPGGPRGHGAGHLEHLLKRRLFIHYAN